jgi:hypothetical protein
MLQFNLTLDLEENDPHTFDGVLKLLQSHTGTINSAEVLDAGQESTLFDHNDSAIGRWKVVIVPGSLPTRAQLLVMVSKHEARQSVNAADHEEYIANGFIYFVRWAPPSTVPSDSGRAITYKCERLLAV